MITLAISNVAKTHKMLYDLTGAFSATTLIAYNVFSFNESFDAGLQAAKVTILGLAIIGLGSQAIRLLGQGWLEYLASKARQEIKLREEQERSQKNSLIAKIAHQETRIEDANRKLHESKNQLNILILNHTEESNRLTQQLDIMTRELYAERQEKTRLINKLEKVQSDFEEFKRLVSQKIESVQTQVSVNRQLMNESKSEN